MSEQDGMVVDATPKKVAFVPNRKYSNEEKIKREEEELEVLKKEREAGNQASEEDEEENEEPKNQEEKSFKKRYGDLRRHSQKMEQDFQKQIDSLKAELEQSTRQEIKMPSSEEEIEEWTKEYPQVASIVETIAIKKAKEMSADLSKQMEDLNAFRANTSKEKAEVELMRLHPDFDQIRDDEQFHDWVDDQPKWVQDALYDNDSDAKSAARAIDLYKADMGIAKKKATKDSSAASSVNTKSSRTAPSDDQTGQKIKESDVQKMDSATYEKQSDAIMEAIRSGNFIYDVTGSAR